MELGLCDGADVRGPSCATHCFTGSDPDGLAIRDGFGIVVCNVCGNGTQEGDELCCCEATPGVPARIDEVVAQCVCAEEWDARCVGDVERLACAQCADG